MKFPLEALNTEKNRKKLLKIIDKKLCDNCLGRAFAMLGHSLSNKERGRIIRKFVSEIEGRKIKEADICELCDNFFKSKINEVVKNVIKKLKKIEFSTFLVGSIISDEFLKKQDELWGEIGIEDVESIKSEINRELGKKIKKLTKKKYDPKNPDITIVVDLKTGSIRTQIKSLYVFGKYQKLVRGIPQSKWVCSKCNGKGCTFCRGKGKLYPTSVQEIIEKPLLKATKAKKSKFHSSGRADIDARELGYRPFAIELVKPLKRKIDLKKIKEEINKSKKVKVKGLKIIENGKEIIRILKTERWDKTYLAVVTFEKDIDKNKLKDLEMLTKQPILQKTPIRVLHRRADKIRKRLVKEISWKILSKRKLQLKVRGEAGLYVKELITGDDGRTKPSVSEILNNKVKKISLDVIKIHTKGI